MSIVKLYQLIEDSLSHLGLNPEDARCAEDGQWLVYRDKIEIYIDLWQETELNEWMYYPDAANTFTFQVAAPICKFPKQEMLLHFYEDVLQMNYLSQYVSFVINKSEKILSCNYKRITENLTKADVVEAIEAVGYYADLSWKMLNEPYQLKKP